MARVWPLVATGWLLVGCSDWFGTPGEGACFSGDLSVFCPPGTQANASDEAATVCASSVEGEYEPLGPIRVR